MDGVVMARKVLRQLEAAEVVEGGQPAGHAWLCPGVMRPSPVGDRVRETGHERADTAGSRGHHSVGR